jgi:hypothetical protein
MKTAHISGSDQPMMRRAASKTRTTATDPTTMSAVFGWPARWMRSASKTQW